jgi:putative membrane protein
VLLIVFVSPLCALSSALFAARTVHHILLVAVAAPLLAAALPRRTGAPALHLALSTAVLWLWHVPAAYDLALSNMAVYWAMQATLFVPALLFWRAVMAEDVPATGPSSL